MSGPNIYTLVTDQDICLARWLDGQQGMGIEFPVDYWAEGGLLIGGQLMVVKKWVEGRVNGIPQWRACVGEKAKELSSGS